jgi:hypothetical protein
MMAAGILAELIVSRLGRDGDAGRSYSIAERVGSS